MDKKKLNIEEEIQKTLDSVDAIQRVEGNPFLYTRLQERLDSSRENTVTTKGWFSPAWQFALIVFLFITNGLVLLQSEYFSTSNEITIDEFATEYELTPSENDEELALYNFNE